MASILISGEEKHYITTGVEEDFRNDGRSCEDYRKVCVKTRVLSSTNGSSEVTLVIFLVSFFFTFSQGIHPKKTCPLIISTT